MKTFFLFLSGLTLFATASFAQVVVTASAGTTGPTPYMTLKGAFDAVNAGTHQGAITVGITGDTAETATASLNASGSGAAVYTSVLVAPSGGARTITGSIVGAIIKLNGADNVTIDGRLSGAGRNLTVSNTASIAGSAGIWLSSTGVGAGCTNNVVRNLEIACGAPQNAGITFTFGIIMSGTTISPGADGDDNDNNSFIANRIIRARYGIVTRGNPTTPNLNISTVVTDNIIGPSSFGADQIGRDGIFMQADTGATVSRNLVQFVGGDFANTTSGSDRLGIAIGSDASPTTTTLISDSYTVTKNIIHDVIEERTFSAVGIHLATTGGGSATNNLVANNFIYNVRANGTSGDQGIAIGISGGANDKVVFNSISLTGDIDPGGTMTATGNNAGIRVANATSASHFGLTLKDNSIYVHVTSNTATLLHYDIVVNSSAYSWTGGGLNNNNYFFPVANPQMRTGGLGAGSVATSSFQTLANWQGVFTPAQDLNSKQADPLYLSNTSDLHIADASPNVDMGQTIAGVTTDIDGEARQNGPLPDIGADEILAAPPTQAGFLYVLNDNTAGNQVYGFSVNETTGALTLLSGFPLATGGNGAGGASSEHLALDSVNQRLYAINDGSDTVTAYSLDPTSGALAPMPFSPIALGAGGWQVAVHPAGSPLVVGNNVGQVRSYTITATTATQAAGSPFTTGSARPFSSVFSRDGAFYYAGGSSGTTFAGFSVNTTNGVLTALAGSAFNSGAANPLAYATDSQGRFFTANLATSLRVFTTAAGVPSPATGNPFASGLIQAVDGVLHPNERFYLVADRGGNQFGSYKVNGSGAVTTLAPATGSPFASSGTFTDALVMSQTGAFLYGANGNSRNLTRYDVSSNTGVLTNPTVQAADTLGAAGRLTGIAYTNSALVRTAVSRKIHSTAGIFDVNLPLTGTPGIECRRPIGADDYQILVTFATPVTISAASVTSGTGSVDSSSVSGGVVTVNLNGVANAQTLTLSLDVSDGVNTSNVAIPISFLLGDTSGNGSVNASDVSQTKAQSGQPVTGANFRTDVTSNSQINAADVSTVKLKSGTGLP